MAAAGKQAQDDWRELGEKHGLPIRVDEGYPCFASFAFTEQPAILKTLYTVLMLEQGFLGSTAIYLTLAHTNEILEKHRDAVDKVFEQIAAHIKARDAEEAIDGPVCHSGFTRLN